MPTAPLFPKWSTPLARGLVVVFLLSLVGVPALLIGWARTPYATGKGRAPAQPVWFDHQQHAGAFRIDCRYCHGLADRAATAGMPSTELCVPCHNQAWLSSSYFAPVRRSLASGRPIPWVRVYDLPDFVYFDHAIHTRKGIGCESCHGRVDRMARISQAVPLTMGWCLDCHRDPEPHLRPVEQATTMGWRPARPQAAVGRELRQRYHVRSLTTCTTCHR